MEAINNRELIIFSSEYANVTIDVQLNNDSVWLSLNQLSTLFGRDKSVISRHLKNVFIEDELDKNSVVAKIATTATDGKTYQVEYYNLDAILSVGYRVSSRQATKFRQWANKVLKDYILKGYVLNNNLLDTTHKEYQQLLSLLNNTLINNQLVTSQGQNILALINDYATTWSSLLQYDEDRLAISTTIHKKIGDVMNSVNKKFSDINELVGSDHFYTIRRVLI